MQQNRFKNKLNKKTMSDVSRSVYQKLKEENKKLLKDINILVSNEFIFTPDRVIVHGKWQRHFKNKRQFNEAMKIVAREYIKEHADELPDFLTKSIQDDKGNII